MWTVTVGAGAGTSARSAQRWRRCGAGVPSASARRTPADATDGAIAVATSIAATARRVWRPMPTGWAAAGRTFNGTLVGPAPRRMVLRPRVAALPGDDVGEHVGELPEALGADLLAPAGLD